MDRFLVGTGSGTDGHARSGSQVEHLHTVCDFPRVIQARSGPLVALGRDYLSVGPIPMSGRTQGQEEGYGGGWTQHCDHHFLCVTGAKAIRGDRRQLFDEREHQAIEKRLVQ